MNPSNATAPQDLAAAIKGGGAGKHYLQYVIFGAIVLLLGGGCATGSVAGFSSMTGITAGK